MILLKISQILYLAYFLIVPTNTTSMENYGEQLITTALLLKKDLIAMAWKQNH